MIILDFMQKKCCTGHRNHILCIFAGRQIKITMKRITTIFTIFLTTIVLCAPTVSAQEQKKDIKILLESYQDNKGVEYMNLKGLLLSFAKPALKDTPMKDMVDGIDNLCVFSMTDASSDDLKIFNKELAQSLSGYEKVVQSKEGKKESTIYLKRKDDASVSEMVVYAGNEDIAIVIIKGDIPVSVLEEMAAQAK